MISYSAMQKRLILVGTLTMLALTAITYRVVSLQTVGHRDFVRIKQQAEDLKRVRMAEKSSPSRKGSIIPAERGAIRDRNGELLAGSRPVMRVYVDNHRIRESVKNKRAPVDTMEEYAQLMAGTMDGFVSLSGEKIRALMLGKKWEWLAEKELHYEKAKALEKKLELAGIEHVDFKPTYKRYYPADSHGCHMVGFSQNDPDSPQSEGKLGVEKEFNRILAGESGFTSRDRKTGEVSKTYPTKGKDVYLTMDLNLQIPVDEIVEHYYEAYDAESITCVLMDAKTSEVLAMSSKPNFDLNNIETEGQFNPAIQKVYEPGSIIKIVPYSAAFHLRKYGPSAYVNCHNGFLRGKGWTIRERESNRYLMVRDAFAKSLNIPAFKMAQSVGVETYTNYLRSFGLGARTGIELTSEEEGQARIPTRVNQDFTRQAFGYALTVTPIQMVTALGVVVNDGFLRKPRVVLSTGRAPRPSDSNVPAVRHVIDKRTAAQMRGMLQRVIDDKRIGTGRLASVPGYSAGGKSGTARKTFENGRGYYRDKYNVSFMGFAPAEQPRFSVIVVVDDPKTVERPSGGKVAGPVFSDVMAEALEYAGVPPTRDLETDEVEVVRH